LSDPVFAARYKEVWNENKDKFSEMEGFIDDMSAWLQNSAAQDRLVEWEGVSDYESRFNSCVIQNNDICAIEEYLREIEKMKIWLRTRIEYYDSLVDGL
jgi:hypothetical protein